MSLKKITAVLYMVVALTIVMRALIPAGFMPDLQSNKAFQMVICTANGAETVTIDGAFDPMHKQQPTSSVEKSCEFSLTQINAPAVLMQLFVLTVLAFAAAFITSRKEFFLKRHRHYSLAAPRAPPQLV